MRAGPCFLCSLAACADVAQPYDLDHARVMAVRVEPPALAPGEAASIDALITDSSEMPRRAEAISVRLPVEAAPFAGALRGDGDRWTITAPDASALATIRASLGLAVDELVIVPLELEVLTLDGSLLATKTVALGARAPNPLAPQILIGGVDTERTMRVGAETTLSVGTPQPELSYRWFSSVGELTGFTRPDATIEPSEPRAGTIAVVVRDQAGGVSWTIEAVEVAP